MPTFTLTGPVLVSIQVPAGDVVLTSSDDLTADVQVIALRDDDATREAVEQSVVELRRDGTELVIEVPKRGWSFFGREPKIRVEARIPHGCDVTFASASADLTAHGRYGEVRAKSASGDLVLDDAASVRVDTASGDVRLRRVAGELTVRCVSGDVRVDAVDAGASVNTVSGDADLGSVGAGTVEVRTVSGDVTIGIREGSRVHVDASSVSGDLRSDLALDDAPGDDTGPLVEVRGRTVSGDVRIRRAAGARA